MAYTEAYELILTIINVKVFELPLFAYFIILLSAFIITKNYKDWSILSFPLILAYSEFGVSFPYKTIIMILSIITGVIYVVNEDGIKILFMFTDRKERAIQRANVSKAYEKVRDRINLDKLQKREMKALNKRRKWRKKYNIIPLSESKHRIDDLIGTKPQEREKY